MGSPLSCLCCYTEPLDPHTAVSLTSLPAVIYNIDETVVQQSLIQLADQISRIPHLSVTQQIDMLRAAVDDNGGILIEK